MLPQLLNPAAAAIAAAIAVPLLVLLYFLKLRRQTMPVASTLLWKKSIQDLQVNSPFQRLRRNLLLLLQLLVLALLLLAFARPVSEGTAIAGERSVILIDRSASMSAADGAGGGTRLDEAKDRARALIGTMTRGSQAMVIAFDTEARIVQTFTGDTQQLRAAIDAITPSDRPTRLRDAYRLANAHMQMDVEELRGEPGTGGIDVFLFSDGRVPPEEAAEVSLQGTLHYERIGTETARNLAVVTASARRNYERPNEVQVFARVGNFGPETAEAAVTISVAEIDPARPGELRFRPATSRPVGVSIPPARWEDAEWLGYQEDFVPPQQAGRRDAVDVTLDLPHPAVIRVEVVSPDGGPVGDVLPLDDVAHVVVPPPEPLRVMLVTEGNYFLELLINSQPIDRPTFVRPEQYESLVAAGGVAEYDVVVFDNYSPRALPAAGTFVYSGGLPPEGTTRIGQVTDDRGLALFYENSEVLDWEREHPMLRGLLLSRVWVAEGRRLTVPLGAELLIEGIRGPMLILERAGQRTHLVFSFDLMLSNWPRQRTFPYFGYLMFQYLAAGADVELRESIRPGEAVTIPRAVLDRAGVAGSVAVTGPMGRREYSVADDGSVTLGPFERVGVYATEPPLPRYERIAASLLDPVESNVLPGRTDPGNISGMDAARAGQEGAGRLRDVEWWWWLVLAAAGMLMVEWIVYTRRVAA